MQCDGCGKTTQLPVPWARGSGFTLLFEALACPVQGDAGAPGRQPVAGRAQAPVASGAPLRQVARARDDMSAVRYVGIDETSVKRGHAYITVVHDLKPSACCLPPGPRSRHVAGLCPGHARARRQPLAIEHACIDMSAAYAKGIGRSLPNAQISYDRFHVVALANAAMDEVRREEMRSSAVAVREAVGAQQQEDAAPAAVGMRKNPAAGPRAQFEAMNWLQRSNLKCARAWRMKQALQLVYREAAASKAKRSRAGNEQMAELGAPQPPGALQTARRHDQGASGWRRARHARRRSNAYVEAMNGPASADEDRRPRLPQHRELHRHGLPAHVQAQASTAEPLGAEAIARDYGRYRHVC